MTNRASSFLGQLARFKVQLAMSLADGRPGGAGQMAVRTMAGAFWPAEAASRRLIEVSE